MMKYAILIFATTFPLQAHENVDVETGQTMLLPFHVAPDAGEPADGLALALAVQNQVVDKDGLIPFTAYRKKLNEYGLSVVSPLSIATRVKLARDLNADRVVFGALSDGGVRVITYSTVTGALSEEVLEQAPMAGLVARLGGYLAGGVSPVSDHQFELFRVWASAYFADEAAEARRVFDKLLEHHLLDWLFMQEYLALFGDPVLQVKDLGDMIYWRDLLLRKSHFHEALRMSDMLMAERHNPRDFVSHAQIMVGLDRREEACAFLARAESFGFTLGVMAPVRSACVNQNPQTPLPEVRSN